MDISGGMGNGTSDTYDILKEYKASRKQTKEIHATPLTVDDYSGVDKTKTKKNMHLLSSQKSSHSNKEVHSNSGHIPSSCLRLLTAIIILLHFL